MGSALCFLRLLTSQYCRRYLAGGDQFRIFPPMLGFFPLRYCRFNRTLVPVANRKRNRYANGEEMKDASIAVYSIPVLIP